MRNKKFVFTCISALTLGAVACNSSEPGEKAKEVTITESPSPTEEPTPTEEPRRDLGGMEFIVGTDWNPSEDDYSMIPEWNQDLFHSRHELMAKYNFSMREKMVANWGSMVEDYISSVENGTPIAQVVKLDPLFVAEPMAKGLFYDLATLDELDFSEEKWNDSVRELMTVGDSIYGMKAGASKPRGGVIFNKRLFEEAGLDPNLLYDLQASGEWTWPKFEELCKTLTRDTNGDGQTDVYATVSQGAETIQCLVASTGSGFVEKDENGRFYYNLESKEVTEALNFAVDLYKKGYEMPQPKDSQWDYFIPAFQGGKAAMQFNELENCKPTGYYGDSMEDEIGFVMPPKPDGTENYHSYLCDDIVVIPSCYDEEEAADIAYAYNIYTEILIPEEGGEGWKDSYYVRFDDERAVEETLQYFADVTNTKQLRESLVYGLGDVMGPDLLWVYPFKEVALEAQIKEISEKWDALVEEANRGREDTDAK